MLEALKELEVKLSNTLTSLQLSNTQFGMPHLIEKEKDLSARLFNGSSQQSPESKKNSYMAALKYFKDQLELTHGNIEIRLLATSLCEPLREHDGKTVIGTGDKFLKLLNFYEDQIKVGKLRRITWYCLLSSYFEFDPIKSTVDEKLGWSQLRAFLERTWPYYSESKGFTPDWMDALRKNSIILSNSPCKHYAGDVLYGDESTVKIVSEQLGIPQSSWFWHHLVLDVVLEATKLVDDDFKETIPRLIELLKERSVYRDDAIKEILTRYHSCLNKSTHDQLRDYVTDKSVWKNPKLKQAGISTSWNQVADEVWKMVLNWVNEINLKLFFELLESRNGVNSGRFAFWSKYLLQITYTKLIFGEHTRIQSRSNKTIAALIALEEGLSSKLRSSDSQVDAFIMGIGDLIVVEFSKQPNAAYLYPKASVPFDLNANWLSDGTNNNELKAGFYHGTERITHPPRWETSAGQKLATHGIYPDRFGANSNAGSTRYTSFQSSAPSSSSISDSPKKSNMPFTMAQLNAIAKLSNATIDDNRPGGRLWVNHNQQSSNLAKQLNAWGFIWANKRDAWYHPE